MQEKAKQRFGHVLMNFKIHKLLVRNRYDVAELLEKIDKCLRLPQKRKQYRKEHGKWREKTKCIQK